MIEKTALKKTINEVLSEETELSEKERKDLTETLVERLECEFEILNDEEDDEDDEDDEEELTFED